MSYLELTHAEEGGPIILSTPGEGNADGELKSLRFFESVLREMQGFPDTLPIVQSMAGSHNSRMEQQLC